MAKHVIFEFSTGGKWLQITLPDAEYAKLAGQNYNSLVYVTDTSDAMHAINFYNVLYAKATDV